jgi:hypothetical protein
VAWILVSAQLGECEDKRRELEAAVRAYQEAWDDAAAP